MGRGRRLALRESQLTETLVNGQRAGSGGSKGGAASADPDDFRRVRRWRVPTGGNLTVGAEQEGPTGIRLVGHLCRTTRLGLVDGREQHHPSAFIRGPASGADLTEPHPGPGWAGRVAPVVTHGRRPRRSPYKINPAANFLVGQKVPITM